MSDKKAGRLNYRESKARKVDGVQVYTRPDKDGRPMDMDAIDEDERKIALIADRLQIAGYGVMRRRKPRAGRVYHLFKAHWAGNGEPPEEPLSE